MEDLFYDLFISEFEKKQYNELHGIMKWYDYKYNISYDVDISNENIVRKKSNESIKYIDLEDFILRGIFYKNKKNLFHYPLENINNSVVNFDLNQYNIVKSNPVIKQLLNNNVFDRYIKTITNYGTFIRFAENKVQRLYWNPSFNAGIPLTAKDKDPIYELIFLLHDFGHFLLPDLVFTGTCSSLHRMVYVIWRLLGESITVMLNEMIVVDYLKDFNEFKQKLKLDYDKPYKLFQKFKKFDVNNRGDIYNLFNSSFKYFCGNNPNGFINLLNGQSDDLAEWIEFDKRYRPVSLRGKEWTQMNYTNIESMKDSYKKWFKHVEPFCEELGLVTIDDIINKLNFDENSDEDMIMESMFNYIFETVIEKLFLTNCDIDLIDENIRKEKAFKRYFIGNLLLLVNYDIDIGDLINNLKNGSTNIYQQHVKNLYETNKLTLNEFHNYIYTMIPPNILKKDSY
jgi:hypothetical protein